MDKAALLREIEGIVGGEEIRDKDTLEFAQHIGKEGTLTRSSVKEVHGVCACQHPNIPLVLLQVDGGFVRVNQFASQEVIQNALVAFPEVRSDSLLEDVYYRLWNRQTEEVHQRPVYAIQVLPTNEQLVNAPANETPSVTR